MCLRMQDRNWGSCFLPRRRKLVSKPHCLRSLSTRMILAIALTLLALPASTSWAASSEQVIHTFSGDDGANPYAGLVFDAQGNLYGTTLEGGDFNSGGVVFKLTHHADGWTESVLHIFTGSPDGAHSGAGLIVDTKGNLYGTTGFGGANQVGTIFKLARGANGKWKETVLYSFANDGNDGTYPSAGLVIDNAGNLYGTTIFGGGTQACPYNPLSPPGCGTVFELSPSAHGKWTEKVLYSFSNGFNGANPAASLILDAAGNLYGTTITGGGVAGDGTVFKLTRRSNGKWTETVLYRFGTGSEDGIASYSAVIRDRTGNLYGTTAFGGFEGNGTVFKLTKNAHGHWTETVLYRFTGSGNDGATPYTGLVFDGSGNLYGSTSGGGGNLGDGTVFKLTHAHGQWTETVLYSFDGNNGTGPLGGNLIFDTSGKTLYGTSPYGGDFNHCHTGCGAVFQLTP